VWWRGNWEGVEEWSWGVAGRPGPSSKQHQERRFCASGRPPYPHRQPPPPPDSMSGLARIGRDSILVMSMSRSANTLSALNSMPGPWGAGAGAGAAAGGGVSSPEAPGAGRRRRQAGPQRAAPPRRTSCRLNTMEVL
jgi:hypothetical protein